MNKISLISALAVVSICTFNASAELISCQNGHYTDGTDCQACGTHCNWSYDEDSHTLVITGSGMMQNYETNANRPWHEYMSDVQSVQVWGVTHIGDRAFGSASNLTSLSISESVTSIGYGAVAHATNLTSVVIPDSVQTIGTSAFYNDSALSTFVLGSDSQLTEVGGWAFSGVVADLMIPDGVAIGRGAFEYNTTKIYCTPNTDCLTDTAIKPKNLVPYLKDKSGAYALLDTNGQPLVDETTGNPIYYLSATDMTTQSNPCTSGYDSCATQALNAHAQDLAAKGQVCNNFESCQALVYADYNGEVLRLNGKDYASLADLLRGQAMPKRIYTVEEARQAVEATGRDTVNFKIRYK